MAHIDDNDNDANIDKNLNKNFTVIDNLNENLSSEGILEYSIGYLKSLDRHIYISS